MLTLSCLPLVGITPWLPVSRHTGFFTLESWLFPVCPITLRTRGGPNIQTKCCLWMFYPSMRVFFQFQFLFLMRSIKRILTISVCVYSGATMTAAALDDALSGVNPTDIGMFCFCSPNNPCMSHCQIINSNNSLVAGLIFHLLCLSLASS
jgi:hypothetical protein